MDIFKISDAMRKACPVKCECSIRFVGDYLHLLWDFKIYGKRQTYYRAIPREAYEDSRLNVIEYSIDQAAIEIKKGLITG